MIVDTLGGNLSISLMHLIFQMTNDSYSAIWGCKYLILTDGKRMTLINTPYTALRLSVSEGLNHLPSDLLQNAIDALR